MENAVRAMGRLSDDALMARIAVRDHEALSELFRRYRDDVYRFDLRILQNESDTLDAIQNKFLQIWRRAGAFTSRPGSKVRNFILKVDKFVCLEMMRARWRRSELGIDDGEDGETGWSEVFDFLAHQHGAAGDPLDEGIVREQDAAALVERVQRFTEDQFSSGQYVAFWGFINGMSYKHIADTYGMTAGSVRGHIARGFRSVRAEFGKEWEEL